MGRSDRPRPRVGHLAALVFGPLLAAGSGQAAPTFTVNNTFDAPGADTLGASLTDGVCETQHGNGICTLRAAIMEANHVAGSGATIVLPAGKYSLTLGPSQTDGEESGDLNLLAPMTVIGAGPSYFDSRAPWVTVSDDLPRLGGETGLEILPDKDDD